MADLIAQQDTPDRLIESLQDSKCYPHLVTSLSLMETHISWIILTGAYAYKIKKPVDFGFLDFSTLEKRKFYCEEELRLNRRFSDFLYIDVVKITGTVSCPSINGKGKTLEYAVRMHEFPQRCLLIEQVKKAELNQLMVDKLAYNLAEFHRGASRPDPLMCGEPVYGSIESVRLPVIENFQKIIPLLKQKSDIEQLQYLENWSVEELSRLAEFIELRRVDGFVRECHGDLHLGNIAVIDGEITFFDCLEFSEQLRWIDTCSELAYLLMDLDCNDQTGFANRLLNKYLEYSGDFGILKLLIFYKLYRAMVRVKVTVLRMEQADLQGNERERLLLLYRHYIDMAAAYVIADRPFLAITHGVSATGKSTVSAGIASQSNAICLRSDVERKRLFALAPMESSNSGLSSGIYSDEATDKTFTHLRQLAADILRSNYSVVVDASFLSRKLRETFMTLARENKIPFVIIDCQAEEAVVEQRIIRRNQLANDVSEANLEVLRKQLLSQDPLTDSELSYTFTTNTENELNTQKFFEIVDKNR